MQTFYVSMARDLLGVFIEFEAESETAVHRYLESEYLTANGTWKLPWCAVYRDLPVSKLGITYVFVKAQCGPLHNAPTIEF